MHHLTLIQSLERTAAVSPNKRAFRYLVDGDDDVEELSYSELLVQSRALAGEITRHAKPGDRVVLLFQSGLDSVVSLFACMFASVVAVPVPPPHPGRITAQADRLLRVVRDSSPVAIISSDALVDAIEQFAAVSWELAAPTWISASTQFGSVPYLPPPPVSDDLALLQYTSGSTSTPRGVMLTHGNFTANQIAICEISQATAQVEMLNWLPFYHDMGLVYYIHPIFLGISCTLMSPKHFVQRPLRWLRAISKYQANGCSAPNFALDRIADVLEKGVDEKFDLSSFRALVVGAEPVRNRTLDRFCCATAPFGFARQSLFPCYGLAESTVLATRSLIGEPVVAKYEPLSLESGKSPQQVGPESAEAIELVGNGNACSGHELIIVDQDGRILDDNQVGEIWLRGPSVGKGYWKRPDDSTNTFGATLANGEGPFLRTGDLGFLSDGELFVQGRIKDLIILLGRNIYAEDVEEIARSCTPDLGQGAAAFQADGEAGGLVVLLEARSRRFSESDAIERLIRQEIARRLEVEVAEVVILGPLSLPRTSSGKIQRKLARDAYMTGSLIASVGSPSKQPLPTEGAQ
jgi:acyl-CoA synthetase (AMP-forming)/AMP-acid ligase II